MIFFSSRWDQEGLEFIVARGADNALFLNAIFFSFLKTVYRQKKIEKRGQKSLI